MPKIGRNDPCPCGSGAKFKRCHIDNWPPVAPFQQPEFLPHAPWISFRQIRDSARGSSMDKYSIAFSVLDYARSHIPFDEFSSSEPVFHAWGAGALVLAAMGTEPLPPTPDSTPRLPDAYVAELLQKVAGLTSDGRVRAHTKAEVDAQTKLTLLRLIATQSSVQGDPFSQAYRTLHLLELIDDDANALADSSPYDVLFEQAYGCTTREYVAAMLGLYVFSEQNTFADVRTILDPTQSPAHAADLLRRILETHGCRAGEVAHLLDTKYAPYQAEGLVQAFYSECPFIRITEHRYLLPPKPFMRLLALSGPIFQALALARKNAAAKGAVEPWTNEHSQRMGGRFELTLQAIARTLFAPEQYVSEYVYDTKEHAKSPDLLVFETADTLLLVQAKLKRLTPGAFFGYDYEAFLADARGALAETVWRSIRYLVRLEQLAAKGRLSPESAVVNHRVLAAKRIIFLGVMPALPGVFRAKPYRSAIDEGTEAALKAPEKEWLKQNRARLAGWHVMDVSELSAFAMLPRARKQGLWTCLRAYLSDLETSPFVSDQGFFPTFRDWCILKYGPAEELLSHSKALGLAFDDGERLLFPHETPHKWLEEAAYYRWIARGRPLGDDWADWFAARRALIRRR